MEAVSYREPIGNLLYLSTRIRPDIAIAVNVLSRQVSESRPIHWTTVKRVFRYLCGTKSLGLLISPNTHILSAHADSDWTGAADRITVTGNAIFFGGMPISWKSSEQSCVALSHTKAEYKGLLEVAKYVQWLINLSKELGYTQKKLLSSTKATVDPLSELWRFLT